MSNAVTNASTSGSPSTRKRRCVQESSSTNLFTLTKQGNHEAILSMLADEPQTESPDIHACTTNGDTALHIAAIRGHLKVVRVLLGAGAKVHAPGFKMRTPLHCAAAHGHLRIAQRLLEAGAEVDVKDASGLTALDVAKDAEVMLLLMRKGAQHNERTVCVAVSQGNKSLFELCLQKGVSNMDICNKEEKSLLVLGAKGKQWEMVEWLLEKGASATNCKSLEECPLVLAAKDDQSKIVRELLIRGANKDSGQMKKALMAAESHEMVWTFAREVPDVVRGRTGELGFLSSSERGRLAPLVAFLDAGVNVNARNNNGQTALYLAAEKGHKECMEELIKRHADLDAKDNKNKTALHRASTIGRTESVVTLLKAGADPTTINKSKKTSHAITASEEIRALLETPKQKPRTSRKPRKSAVAKRESDL